MGVLRVDEGPRRSIALVTAKPCAFIGECKRNRGKKLAACAAAGRLVTRDSNRGDSSCALSNNLRCRLVGLRPNWIAYRRVYDRIS